MTRPAKYSVDDLLDAAAAAVVDHGKEATLQQVAAAAGAPIGSLYHRFASRDELMARLWVRSIQRFHEGLLAVGDDADPHGALVAMALHIPRFCRDNPADALAMTLHRQPVLAASTTGDLQDVVATINDDINGRYVRLARAHWGRLTKRREFLVMMGCLQSPYGLVRPYCGAAVPKELDDIVRASTEAILALG